MVGVTESASEMDLSLFHPLQLGYRSRISQTKTYTSGSEARVFGSLSVTPPLLDALDGIYMMGSWGDRIGGTRGDCVNTLRAVKLRGNFRSTTRSLGDLYHVV